jgi:hypothetical protein
MSPEQTIDKTIPKDVSEALPVLTRWSDELNFHAEKHRKSAHRLRNLNRFLGGLNVAVAAVTATAMYAALNKKLENLDLLQQLIIRGVAVLPAVASGLQREWQVTAREQGHLALAQDCRQLLKQLEFYFAFPPSNFRDTIAPWHQRYAEVISRPVVRLT